MGIGRSSGKTNFPVPINRCAMQMNKTLGLLVAAFCAIPAVNATSGDRPPARRSPSLMPPHRAPDLLWQQELRESPAWQAFARNGAWYVEYNEASRTPHRAYGRPVAVAGNGPEERASIFLQHELAGFRLPVQELELSAVHATEKYTYVRYRQRHVGTELLFARYMVKLDQQGRVVSFGSRLYADVQVGMTPAIGARDAASGQAGLPGFIDTEWMRAAHPARAGVPRGGASSGLSGWSCAFRSRNSRAGILLGGCPRRGTPVPAGPGREPCLRR